MVIGASNTSGANASTGTFTVSGENVESKNALDIFAADATLTNTTTATGLAITGTFSGTGGVTSGNDATADLVGAAITIDTKGSFGAAAASSIDVTATGVLSISVGDASTNTADTIYLNSLGDVSLGHLLNRDSATLDATDLFSIVSAGHVIDGNAATTNLTAGKVTIDVAAGKKVGEPIGTGDALLEIASISGVDQLLFKVAGAESETGARFAGVHVDSNAALTLQNDLFSTAGVTLRSSGAFIHNGMAV
jgi:hypothetical protein